MMTFSDLPLPRAALLGAGLAFVMAGQGHAESFAPKYDEAAEAAIQKLLEDILNMDIQNLPAMPIQAFSLPEAGVDVLRAKVSETYTIDGVGSETVELTGWIAVLHGDPESIIKGEEVTWENFQVGTEFVGLDLRGESDLFGPIQVTLNQELDSIGRVGVWEEEVPHDFLLHAGLEEEEIDDLKRPPGDCAPTPSSDADGHTKQGVCCYAPLAVKVSMQDLDLEMVSDRPVLMYSYVETIPPVGYVASTSLAPRPLMDGDRAVGTLQSAAVTFREIVHHMPLDGQLLDGRFDVFVAAAN